MGVISIANYDDSDHFLPLFSRPLDSRYQIWFYSITQLAVVLCTAACDWLCGILIHLLCRVTDNGSVVHAPSHV